MEQKKLSLKNISANLFVYGTAHGLVDLICAGVIFSVFANKAVVNLTEFINLVILYSVLAFGLQIIFGLMTDYFKSPRIVTLLGCIFVGLSAFVFMFFPILAIVFAGIGNALFHVGGGSISLNLTPKKVTAPGIYVAPGALGLFIGVMLGKAGQFIAWPFVLAMFVLCILIFIIKKPEMNYDREEIKKNKINYFEVILFLVFLSIAIRSFVGMAMVFPWKTNIDLAIIFTMAVVFGKAFGGILADKFGWIKIAVGALVLSIPFLVFGTNIPFLAIIGMFLFNITMPITLVAISNILPGRPGLAFGTTCLALIIGASPTFNVELKTLLSGKLFIFSIIIISALALYFALRSYFRNFSLM
jgi:MFS transporter, FSR family, fosmidomycin resistance protein